MKKAHLTDLSLKELTDLLHSWGESPFHAPQIWRWLYRSLAESFDGMSDLPQPMRHRLGIETNIGALRPIKELVSTRGDTVKALFCLEDKSTIESVSMHGRASEGKGTRHTLCISTQVGCPVGCPFCATGQHGFRRNLSPGEMVEQVLYFARTANRPVSNVVFMGMGEPLANYDATLKAIRILNSPQGFNLGARRITVSTAGLAPQIMRLAGEDLQVGLAVSLHAANDALRNTLVPLNIRYPIRKLLDACRAYFAATSRRVTFECVLFDGLNDSISHARQMAKLLTGMNCHVNLIPANTTTDPGFQPTSQARIRGFQAVLKRRGIAATTRRSMGADIRAGCGQLGIPESPTVPVAVEGDKKPTTRERDRTRGPVVSSRGRTLLPHSSRSWRKSPQPPRSRRYKGKKHPRSVPNSRPIPTAGQPRR
ncbi:MAG: 23S rRNA (adenine(2503)-C(2))-methyltransferase RlmN [Dehalococcoidia bacterium]|jgi:23S rRNA (adenine2503-C2)-methyltransferase|nr:23S rRNA (adenine(2503)-C(2))-methyltransferase RlmN [Dehalococcoidia bacterium]